MQVTGMLYGAKLLRFAGFPTADVLGPDASEEDIKALIDRHGSVFVKPVFKGGVGKKGKAGLLGRASDLKTALREKERLYFVEHRVGHTVAKANGVTFEGAVPADHAHALAGLHEQACIIEQRDVSVGDGDVIEGDERHNH